MDDERLKLFRQRLEEMSRSYAATLAVKADELEQSAHRWRDGEADARQELADRVHRLVSAGSFGFAGISDRAMSIEEKLVDGASLADVQSELDELIAYVRSESTGKSM